MALDGVTVGPLYPGDAAEAGALLDRSFGAGFSHIEEADNRMTFAAHADSRVVGVIVVTMHSPEELEAFYFGRVAWPGDSLAHERVALLSAIAVEPHLRRAGVGDLLLHAAEQAAQERFDGRVGWWVANAWIHARTGHCPASHLLERNGFNVGGRVPDFFAGMPSDDCPGCGAAPCRCSVRVYFRHQGSPQYPRS